jgi:hypothetical protein
VTVRPELADCPPRPKLALSAVEAPPVLALLLALDEAPAFEAPPKLDVPPLLAPPLPPLD